MLSGRIEARYPANIYLFKVNNETLERSVKYIQNK